MKEFNDKKLMTKKAWKQKQKRKRVLNNMNTGTRDMKSNKRPTRAKEKEKLREVLDNL
jgi:hypothetical protein